MGAAGRRRPTLLRDLRVTPSRHRRPATRSAPRPTGTNPRQLHQRTAGAAPGRPLRPAPRLGTGAAVTSLLYGWTPAGALPAGRSSVTDSVTESIFAREKKIGK